MESITIISATGPDGIERGYTAERLDAYREYRWGLPDSHPNAIGAASCTLQGAARLLAAADAAEDEANFLGRLIPTAAGLWPMVDLSTRRHSRLMPLYEVAARATVALAAADERGDYEAADNAWFDIQSAVHALAGHQHRGSDITVSVRGGVVRVTVDDREAIRGIPLTVRRAPAPAAGIFGVIRGLIAELSDSAREAA